MPKPTFFKLTDTKRKKFIQEAYQEFSLNSYEGASITNLVKSLGIAKGSVYQYFEDKEDLYNFLVMDALSQLNELLDKACPYQGEDFFEWYIKLLMVEVKFMLSFPQFAVLFINLTAAISTSQKQLARQVAAKREDRISQHLPPALYHSELNIRILSEATNILFRILSIDQNIQKSISAKQPMEVESTRLVTVCTAMVDKIKQGL